MNLVESLSKQIGADTVGKLAGLLGEDQSKTQSALGALIPTLMAGFAGSASTEEGARQLSAAVDQAGDDPAGGLAAMLGGAQPQGDPLGLLGSLLGGGGNMVEKLLSVLTDFLGIKEGSVKKLLTLGVPLVLGYFKKQKQEHGLDAAGLGKLLAGQKDHIAAAMPSGLGKVLANTAGLGSLGSIAQGLLGSAGDAARTAGAAAQQAAATTAQAGSSFGKRILPILVIIVLALLAWKLFNRGSQEEKPAAADKVTMLQDDLKTVFTQTAEQVSAISDAESARSALPELRNLASRVGTLAGSVNALQGDARTTISGTLKPLLATLKPVLDKAMAIPGVSDVIQPVVGPMLETLEKLAAI